VEIREFDDPTLDIKGLGRRLEHGAILKVIASNICGGDFNLVRGRKRSPFPDGHRLGHEVTAEVVDVGRDVERIAVGDIVSVPFIVACGRCHKCSEGSTQHCEVMAAQTEITVGYNIIAGQAQYVTVPYVDFNLLVYPRRDEALAKILDVALLSDTFPTGYHGAEMGAVQPGDRVYIAGAGPIGLACATACLIKGAAAVFVGDMVKERLQQAEAIGCIPVDLDGTGEIGETIWEATGTVAAVDAAIDCVGFAASGHGNDNAAEGNRSTFLNSLIQVVRPGGRVVLLGEYVAEDLAGIGDASSGRFSLMLAHAWSRSQIFTTGRCPVMRYNHRLMRLIMHDRVKIARNLNATVISMEEAGTVYASEIVKPTARKYVIDPNSLLARNAETAA
jgi:glutathione-independent formaldehyde dehydrogenase